MVRAILEGLREMHSKNIMHRDLKPENILFRSKGSLDCVIADYGLAEFADSEEYLFMRCGTPGYVAPEVINLRDMKAKYTPICDIFSLGLIFHILLFGRSIFKGKTYNEVLAENRLCSFSLDGAEYAHVDTPTMDLLQKMLRVTPE
jgi:calcium-dependent protein kinase